MITGAVAEAGATAGTGGATGAVSAAVGGATAGAADGCSACAQLTEEDSTQAAAAAALKDFDIDNFPRLSGAPCTADGKGPWYRSDVKQRTTEAELWCSEDHAGKR